MKPKNLPKLKFKMMNREMMRQDQPLDLSINKKNRLKPILFKPYIDCNSSYKIKSQQVKSTLLSNQMMINELMMKNFIDYPQFSSPFNYESSLFPNSPYYSSNCLTQNIEENCCQQSSINFKLQSSVSSHNSMIINSYDINSSPIPKDYQRSPSYSPTSNCSSYYTSSSNSTNSFDFNYKPFEMKRNLNLKENSNQQPIDLTKNGANVNLIKIKPKKIKQIKENNKLMKNSMNQNQILIKCPSCWQLFDQENSLLKHIKSKHQIYDGSSTFDRIHKCEHCVLAFTRFDMLQRHNRKHTGEKPYECNICFQNFSRSDHLNTHRINHFGLKMYKCSKCLYASSRRDMVSRHLQTHSNGQDSDAYVKTDLNVKELCKKLINSTPDQIPDLLKKFKLECYFFDDD